MPEKGGLREAAGRREAGAWAAVQLGCFKLTACPQRLGNAQDRAGAWALDGGRAASLTTLNTLSFPSFLLLLSISQT